MRTTRLKEIGTDPKAYLSQMFYLDSCISTKKQQLEKIKKTEDTVDFAELKDEIKNDMNELVNLKKKIKDVINDVPDPVYKALLEKRYLSCLSWNRIAMELGFELRYVHKLHKKALAECVIPKEDT